MPVELDAQRSRPSAIRGSSAGPQRSCAARTWIGVRAPRRPDEKIRAAASRSAANGRSRQGWYESRVPA